MTREVMQFSHTEFLRRPVTWVVVYLSERKGRVTDAGRSKAMTILSSAGMREQASWLRRQVGNAKAQRAAELFEAAALAADRKGEVPSPSIVPRGDA